MQNQRRSLWMKMRDFYALWGWIFQKNINKSWQDVQNKQLLKFTREVETKQREDHLIKLKFPSGIILYRQTIFSKIVVKEGHWDFRTVGSRNLFSHGFRILAKFARLFSSCHRIEVGKERNMKRLSDSIIDEIADFVQSLSDSRIFLNPRYLSSK